MLLDRVELLDRVLGTVLPAPMTRTPYTRADVILLCASSLSLILAAHIRIRRPGLPLLLRVPLAIVGVLATMRLLCSHYTPVYFVLGSGRAASLACVDFVAGVAAAVWSMMIVEFLLLGQEEDFDVRGVGEYLQWQADNEQHAYSNGGHGSDTADGYTLERPRHFPGCELPLEIDILASIRGFGYGRGAKQDGARYKAGYSAYVQAKRLAARPPAEARVVKWAAMRNVVRVMLQTYVAVDVIETFAMHPSVLPGVRAYGPSSLRDAERGVMGSAGPWVLTVLLAIFIVSFMQTVSTLGYILSLAVTAPADAPITISRNEPLMFAQPHLSTSLRAMWGTHWHVYFRRIFVVFGYKPAKRVAVRLGAPRRLATMAGVLGSFVVSGLMHEMCLEAVLPHFKEWDPAGAIAGSIRTAGRGYGANGFVSTRFFVAQGIGIVMEDAWTSYVEPWLAGALFGRKVVVGGRLRSVLGWTWCMTYMAYFGYGLINVWLEHGVAPTAFSLQLSGPIVHAVLRLAGGD